MLARRSYYFLKPVLPWSFRLALRRSLAGVKRKAFADRWPISPGSAVAPTGWTGWPEGKQFAFILTHDVEGADGVERCRALMKVEQRYGFRSSFNFIPEGGYETPKELRDYLVSQGFEVGVHDLHHDGKLYLNRATFQTHAKSINRYLREWNAKGFRSGFMHHNLDWIHDLEIQYDASTFDTDPFEPQPDGVETIFPFRVKAPSGHSYIELPYTLAQDFNLFVVLQEKDISIWKRKLDWIANHGGMALMNTHPDYMYWPDEEAGPREFPITLYEQFLQFVHSRYAGRYWHGVPHEVATWASRQLPVETPKPASSPVSRNGHSTPAVPAVRANGKSKKIWIDLDNTPHVPFFIPIIRALEEHGHTVLLSARDAFQVAELADQKGLNYVKIGRHHGRNKLIKVLGLLYRAFQLSPVALSKPDLALSHGARSQVIASNLVGIPTVIISDYEFAKSPPLMRPKWEIVPSVIPDDLLACDRNQVRKYPGIKEDVYVPFFRPDPSLMKELGLRDEELIATVRPPATEAHYHNPESEILFAHFMKRLLALPNSRAVLLPRNKRQESWIREQWPEWFHNDRTIVPAKAVDGLNLVWHSDFVVSGGGTMNREAAALGVPVYSIFRGRIGAVDHYLQNAGRLVLIESITDVENKIKLERRLKSLPPAHVSNEALSTIIRHLEDILDKDVSM